jgi:catechol 2,3-dioxygenase
MVRQISCVGRLSYRRRKSVRPHVPASAPRPARGPELVERARRAPYAVRPDGFGVCAARMAALRLAQWAKWSFGVIVRHMKTTAIATTNEVDPRSVRPIAAGASIGHIHLKVANLERAIAFYSDVLGFEVTERYGRNAAFLSAGGYHHHIGLNTWESAGGDPPAPGTTGLYHVAILYPTRADLADALRRLLAHGIRIDGASDHGVSEAIYLRDPDGNGLELYRDRPREEWPRSADGSLAMSTDPLDLESLLAER